MCLDQPHFRWGRGPACLTPRGVLGPTARAWLVLRGGSWMCEQRLRREVGGGSEYEPHAFRGLQVSYCTRWEYFSNGEPEGSGLNTRDVAFPRDQNCTLACGRPGGSGAAGPQAGRCFCSCKLGSVASREVGTVAQSRGSHPCVYSGSLPGGGCAVPWAS